MHRRESAKGDATAPRWTVDELFSTRPHVCGACTLSTETRGAGVRLTAGEAAASRARR